MRINIYHIILISLFVFTSMYSHSQDVEKYENLPIEDIIEEIASNSDEELDYTTLYDDLNFLYYNPLNINTATEEDFEKLQILTEFQIKSIINYRKRHGNLLTIYELQLIDGFNFDLIGKIIPFITVSGIHEKETLKINRAIKYGNHQVFIRTSRILEEQKGYSENDSSSFLGDQNKVYTKYKYQYKNRLFWGVTMEKDPGEQLFKGEQKNGFDYYSAHFLYKGDGYLKRLAVGDYILRFGQGLAMWSGMGTGKSAYVLNVKKKGQGISKYSSTDENRFQRGIASTINYKDIDLTVFTSLKAIDANLVYANTSGEKSICSLQSTGYHRTYSELKGKDQVSELITGSNINYNHTKFKAGITYVNQAFEKDILAKNDLYKIYDFYGKRNYNLSADYQFELKDFYFFGELAQSKNNALAFISGFNTILAPQVSLSLVYRNFAKDYQSLYGVAFSEGSGVQNEKGIYIGTEIFPVRNWKISAYYDNYKFSWLRFGIDAPSHGNDYLMQVDYTPSRNLQMYLRYKNERKLTNFNIIDENIRKPDYVISQSLRYHITIKISDAVKLKTRVELKQYDEPDETSNGYLIYQDVNYTSKKFPLTANFRFGVFDTDSYDSRIYAYENDVLYAFSIPAYYSQGIRTYLTLKYSITQKLDVWLRISQTNFSDKIEIGSGNSLIKGNTKSEFKFQLRYKL